MARKMSNQEFSLTWLYTTNVTSEKQVQMYFWKNPPQLTLGEGSVPVSPHENVPFTLENYWTLKASQGRASQNNILQNMLLKKM